MTTEEKKAAYIPAEWLNGLKEYKYTGADRSLVANVVGQPFWNWAVGLVPVWMAPNLITLVGLGGILLSYVLLTAFEGRPHGSVSCGLHLLAALLLFAYQTLDALDGKQARRTGTSSPLGELFDHGCDAVTGTFLCLNLLTAMAVPAGSPLALLAILNVVLPFYMAQWEQYHTGVLVLGLVNVTEAQLVSMLVFALSALYGPSFWALPCSFLLPSISSLPSSFDALPLSTLIFAPASLGGLWNMAAPLLNVASHCRARPRPVSALLAALSHLLPLLLLAAAALLWVALSPTGLLGRHPHLLLLTVGFLNSSLVGRVILARVCGQQHVSPLPLVLLPFLLASLFVALAPALASPFESLLIAALTLYSVVTYIGFAFLVIRDLCSHLHINALSMTASQLARAKQLVNGLKKDK